MAKKTKMYVKLPSAGPKKWQYTEVDVERFLALSEHTIKQIYSLQPGGEGRNYRPITSGVGVLPQNRTILEESLKEQLDETITLWLQSLEQYEEAGIETANELTDTDVFLNLINAITLDDPEELEHCFQSMLYAMMGGSLSLAAKLYAAETTASGMTTSFEMMTTGGQDAWRNLYFTWSGAAESLIAALDKLRELVNEAEEIQSETIRLWNDTESKLQLDEGDMKSALDFLDGNQYSFLIEAESFIRKPKEDDPVLDHLDTARTIVRAVLDTKHDSLTSWNTYKDKSMVRLQEILRDATSAIGDLREASAEFRLCERMFGHNEKPYEVANDDYRFTTEENYKSAQELLRDPETGPAKLKDTVYSISNASMEFFNQSPTLPEEIEVAVQEASVLIEQINSILSEEEVEDDIESEDFRDERGVVPTATVVEVSLDARERVNEVYEMMQCVAMVVTCKKPHLAATTVKAMLQILVKLNQVSESEFEELKPAVKKLIHGEGDVLEIEERAPNTYYHWKTSDKLWISFYPTEKVRSRFYRIPRQAASRIEALFQKHNLNREEIMKAKDIVKKERDKARRLLNQQRSA